MTKKFYLMLVDQSDSIDKMMEKIKENNPDKDIEVLDVVEDETSDKVDSLMAELDYIEFPACVVESDDEVRQCEPDEWFKLT